MDERHCSGAVLAGGANARFGGAPKGLSMIDGRRVVDRVLDALAGAVDERFLIADNPSIRESVSGVVAYGDTRPERGSLVGLHSALSHSRAAALVVAWDMPFVSADLLAHLRAIGEHAGAAAIPVGTAGPEPLCAYYPRAVLPHVERQLDAGDLRLSRFVATLESAVVLPLDEVARFGPPRLLFANVNTPADLAAARAWAGADLTRPLVSLAEHR
jgi:molybdopterin-guanine dinucleotide biosynthesis protein A